MHFQFADSLNHNRLWLFMLISLRPNATETNLNPFIVGLPQRQFLDRADNGGGLEDEDSL